MRKQFAMVKSGEAFDEALRVDGAIEQTHVAREMGQGNRD
jgi:hypothetical protein